jgi:hypothetical protein
MSFLARITQRAIGAAASAPVLRPKDRGIVRVAQPSAAAPDAAADDMEEGPEPQEQESPTAHRASALEPEEAAMDAPDETPVRRETTDSASWIDEDPEIATTEGTVAHRAAVQEAEEEVDDQPDVQRAIRAIRPPPSDPAQQEDEPKPEATAGEPEPPTAHMARRAAAAPGSTTGIAPGLPPNEATAASPFATETWPASITEEGDVLSSVSSPPQHHHHHQQEVPTTAAVGFERPQVFIDQVDVLVHEPAAPPNAKIDSIARTRSRFVDARYLRRL